MTDILINNLIFLRQKSKLTQEVFSKKLGISRGCLSSYEERRAVIQYYAVESLSRFTGVDCQSLMFKDLTVHENDVFEQCLEVDRLKILISNHKNLIEYSLFKINEFEEKITQLQNETT